MTSPLPFILAALSVAVLHTLSPDHWLPFVLIAKAQKWQRKTLLSIVIKAGTSHVLVTSVIGLLILFAGFELSQFAEGLETYVASPLLGSVGALYIARYIRRERSSCACHSSLPDNVAKFSAIGTFSFSPCVGILPVFVAASMFGGSIALSVLPVFGAVTLGSMLLFTSVAYHGIQKSRFARWEKYEELLIGFILATLGVTLFILG